MYHVWIHCDVHIKLHVNDVVMDWSYALAGFLVSTLLCFPRPILAIFHIANVFFYPD